MGLSAENARFPEESLSVTVLCDSIGSGFPTDFLPEIARAVSAQASPRTPQTPPSDAAAPGTWP